MKTKSAGGLSPIDGFITQAVILVGGMGSRLHPLTTRVPKSLTDVGGKPFLDYLLDYAIRYRFRSVLLLAGWAADQINLYVESSRYRLPSGVTIKVSVEPEPYGTAGAIFHARHWREDRFMLFNGDSYFDIDCRDLEDFGRTQRGSIVVALYPHANTTRFGVAQLVGCRVASSRKADLDQD